MSQKKTDRREFLKRSAAVAGAVGLGAAKPALGQDHEHMPVAPEPGAFIRGSDEMTAYGSRSRFVNSVRIPHGGRESPDAFGLDFHIATPLQDSVGEITPSSLH